MLSLHLEKTFSARKNMSLGRIFFLPSQEITKEFFYLVKNSQKNFFFGTLKYIMSLC